MKIGILGGTFDPVHLGHVALAEAAIECARLDRLLVIPARTPPHREPAAAAPQDRLEMCRLAFAQVPRAEVSDLEIVRDGPSFTADTLADLAADHPGADLRLVLGWDAARLLPAWHEPDRVTRLAALVLFPRPGMAGPTPEDLSAAGIDPGRTILCEARTPPVHATEIRRLVAEGKPLDGLVAPAVAAYIAERGLYGDNASH